MKRARRACAALAAATGLAVLVGWYTGGSSLTTMFLGETPMRPNTAVGFIVLGVAVASLDRRRLSLPLAAAATALGGATLLESLLGRSLGIDMLLPGIDLGVETARMAPATAFSLLLLGAGVIAGGLDRATLMRVLALVSLAVSQVAMLGYAYGVSSLYTVAGATSMALHTAVCVAVLSVAILVHDPSAGLVGLLRDKGSAGNLLRPIAPFILLGPTVLGGVRLWAQDQGWFDTRFGIALLVMSMTVLGGALSWRAAVRLQELDRERDGAWAAMDETNRTLEATVTERTRELADRQSFTDGLLETIEVGIVSCDAKGQHLVRNRAQREMAGVQETPATLQPAETQPLVDILDKDGVELTFERHPLMRTLRGEDLGALDLLIGPLGGPHREVVARGNQILALDGAVLGAVALLTDVTVERTASRALDEQHRQLVESQRIGQLGGFQCDIATDTWTYSDQMYDLWGVAQGCLSSEIIAALILEADREIADGSWADAVRLGGRHIQEFRINRADDSAERVVRATLEVDLGSDGQPLRVRGTHLDITELAAAEKAAQRANAFFEAVLTATPDYTFVTDLESGGVLYGSPGKEVLGITNEELEILGAEGIASLFHPDDQLRLRAINAAARDLQDGQVLQLHCRGMHTDGQWHWLSRRVTPFRRDSSGTVVEVLGVVRDITDVVNAEQRLTHAALHDSLTGLPNRALLVDRLDAALARSGRDGREVAVLFCDLDGFKRVNDTAGHAAGDALLLEIAHRLTTVLRDDDTVARVGGDEFVIIIEPWDRPFSGDHTTVSKPDAEADRAMAQRVAERIAEVVRQPVTVNDVEHMVTASIGVTHAQLAPAGRAGPVTAEQVLQDADAAMYLAKTRGKDRVEVFEHGLRTDMAERGRVEQALREALNQPVRRIDTTPGDSERRGKATLAAAYQPILDADTMSLVGFEALARLTDSDGLDIAPTVFIGVAEVTGLIHPLGRVMLESACSQLHRWRTDIPGLEHVTMAINISALQAQHSALADDIHGVVTAHHLTPADLVLELTETALLHAAHSTINTLRALHTNGVGIAIADFGVGYASLSYLATLPVTAVKIDRSFTAGLPQDPTSRKIVNAVAGLAADLDLACIVEGIETTEQLAALPNWVRVQGFLTGRPQQPEMLDVQRLLSAGVSSFRRGG
jgi:diguanylate cyclase (GGDEF)-like protein/PAS domain S-box-containing protein